MQKIINYRKMIENIVHRFILINYQCNLGIKTQNKLQNSRKKDNKNNLTLAQFVGVLFSFFNSQKANPLTKYKTMQKLLKKIL